MTSDPEGSAGPAGLQAPVLELEGDLDAHTAADMIGGLFCGEAAAEHGYVLDLRRIRFVDSSGLGALLGVTARAREQQRTLRLRNPPSQLQRLMVITGTYGQFRWG